MLWIYSYLIAWVLGGVLLTASLLLGQKAAPAPGPREPLPGADANPPGAVAAGADSSLELASDAAPSPALARVWLACLGFGGAGLSLEALGRLSGSLRPAAAAAAALGLLVLGSLLARRRA